MNDTKLFKSAVAYVCDRLKAGDADVNTTTRGRITITCGDVSVRISTAGNREYVRFAVGEVPVDFKDADQASAHKELKEALDVFENNTNERLKKKLSGVITNHRMSTMHPGTTPEPKPCYIAVRVPDGAVIFADAHRQPVIKDTDTPQQIAGAVCELLNRLNP